MFVLRTSTLFFFKCFSQYKNLKLPGPHWSNILVIDKYFHRFITGETEEKIPHCNRITLIYSDKDHTYKQFLKVAK